MIKFNLTKFVGKFVFDNLLSKSFFYSSNNNWQILPLYKKHQKFDTDLMSKISLIQPIARFYELPYFEFKSPNESDECQTMFYQTLIKALYDFPIRDSNYLRYIASNHGFQNVNSSDELIGHLKYEIKTCSQNMYPYRMGFRTIYSILRTNINNVTIDYLQEINHNLSGFKNSYFNKELLI